MRAPRDVWALGPTPMCRHAHVHAGQSHDSLGLCVMVKNDQKFRDGGRRTLNVAAWVPVNRDSPADTQPHILGLRDEPAGSVCMRAHTHGHTQMHTLMVVCLLERRSFIGTRKCAAG